MLKTMKFYFLRFRYLNSYEYLINNSVRPQQHMVDNELKIDFNRFTELMNGEYLKK